MMNIHINLNNSIHLDAHVRVRLRVGARAKIKNAQNRLIFILHTFQAILSISKICARPRPRAPYLRAHTKENVKTPFFHLICDPNTFLNHSQQLKVDFNSS